MIAKNRLSGISFIVRCHNEQDTIHGCLNSLRGITVPHEILVFLHRCTDNSKQIVESLRADGLPIKIYEYENEISRAGYETLITPIDDPHSMMSYCNFCFNKAQFNWLFRWDADFFATVELKNFLNSLDVDDRTPTYYKIKAQLGDKHTVEPYLNNCMLTHGKYLFWEYPVYPENACEKVVSTDICIQSIPTTIIKKYWFNTPWFTKQESYDQKCIDKLKFIEEKYGKEPPGLARSSNNELDKFFFAIKNDKKLLEEHEINFFR